MKLDLTPRQAAWLRDALRRVDEGQNLDDEEQAALDTYYNAEYYEWLQDREIDGRPLTPEQENYLQAFVGYDGQPDGARVYHDPAQRRAGPRSSRKKRGGCLGNLIVLALLAWGIHWIIAREKPAPAPQPTPTKSVGEVVAAKAAELRAAKAGATEASPAPASRSAWRTETYTGATGAQLPMLVADDILGTGCMVVRDPAGACLVEIQAPASLPFDGPEKWRTPIMDGKRRIIGTRWVRQDARRAMLELTDASGQFNPKQGRAILDAILADGAETIVVPYPRASSKLHGLSISLDGLADALADARRGVAEL